MSTANLSMSAHRFSVSPSSSTSRRSAYPVARWVMFAASLIALLVSVYLAWASFTSSSLAGCGGGSVLDCGHVLHSRWSTVLSVPVSVPAIATYVLVLGMLIWHPVSPRLHQIRWTVIGLASLTAGAAALWFTSLQVFWLQHLCVYCLLAHASAIALALTFLVTRPISNALLCWIGGGAIVSLGSLIAMQTLNEVPQGYQVIEHSEPASTNSSQPVPESGSLDQEPTLFQAPGSARADQPAGAGLAWKQYEHQVTSLFAAIINPAMLLQGQVDAGSAQQHTVRVLNNLKLDTSTWPLVGKPDAELVFVELFDYTCAHCQKTHRSLQAARQKFGDRLAIIMLPVPLDRECNPTVKQTHNDHREACELAKLAVAVWKVEPEKFAEFHDYLFDAKPSYREALTKAGSLVEQDRLDPMLRSSLPSDYIAQHVSLYQKAGAGTIPKLLFPRVTTVGAVESPAAMERLIKQYLP